MELNHLQTFVVVTEEKSITQAAKRLFTTPSSISVQIKTLEDELGFQLFVRTARGMQITEKGQALVLKARQTLETVHDFVSQATGMRTYLMGEIALGLNASLGFLRIPELIQKLNQEASGLNLHLHHHASGHVIEHVLAEKLDLGFVFGKVNDNRLSVKQLSTAELVIAAPFAWDLERADWPELSRHPWISSDYYCPFQVIVDQAFKQQTLSYHQVIRTNDDVSKAELVSAGLGLSLLEATEAQTYAQTGKIRIVKDISFPCALSVICLSYRHHDPLVETVSRFIQTLWQGV